MKRVIGIALAVGALAGGFSAQAYASPDPNPNNHAVDAACENVPNHVDLPFCD